MSLRRKGQGSINQSVYQQERTVLEYVNGRTSLLPAEQAVLERLGDEISGTAVLDIGIGAGRTTAVMLEATGDYVGIDFSEAMVAATRARFPDATILHRDARQMQDLGHDRFGFIWFSFNGIDSVNHEERQGIVRQVFKMLKPGGLFYFSSHNLTARVEKPWQLRLYEWSWGPGSLLRNLDRLSRGILNYLRRKPLHVRGEHFVIQTDSAHEFACLHYYADPADQVRRLQETGFVDIQTMGWMGEVHPPAHETIRRAVHVHYLARKPF